MTIAAGIDIGNSTTEIVIGRLADGRVEVLCAGRTPTRRAKGSAESLDGAVALVRRLEQAHGVRVEIAVAPLLRPVDTRTASLPESEAATGRLRVVAAGAATAGGLGVGAGRPHRLGDPCPGTDSLVAVIPTGIGYLAAMSELLTLHAAGRLGAVVLADDEAVLVSNRLGGAVPVVDEVDAEDVLRASLLAVEVATPGKPLRMLTDPLRIIDAFGLAEHEREDAARIAGRLYDVSNAVVALDAVPAPTSLAASGWVDIGGNRESFTAAHEAVRAGPVGLAQAYAFPPGDHPTSVDDLWTVDLSAVADSVMTRIGVARSRSFGLAALQADAPYTDPGPALSERLGVPVQVAASEARAAWDGAMSTPGAGEAVVIDIGGGTVDSVSREDEVVAAGGGELLTLSVGALTGATGAAAEWVKRGPAHRVEAPQILLAEDGTREFLDRPAPAQSIGSLVVRGPAGLLPFHRTLAPGEWRALRLRLKVELIGGNVARALRTLDVAPTTVIAVGGPAADDEVLSALGRALPTGVAVGRGNVAGSLSHRYAVAYGLLLGLAGSNFPSTKESTSA